MAIGLKGSLNDIKNYSFKGKIREIKWQLYYAWQRAWRGYDDRDMFCMDAMFIDKYKCILKDYNKNRHCLFNVPEEYRDVFNKINFNDDETCAIIDTMLFHLEMMDEDHVEKVLYGKNVYDDDYDISKDFSVEKALRVYNIMNQNKKAFMKLFDMFFWELWD